MHAIESIIDTSRRSEKPVTAARGSEIAARAPQPPRCNPSVVVHGTRDPNGATGGCDGPEDARRVASRRTPLVRRRVPRPTDGTRGRSDGNHVCPPPRYPPVRRGVSRRPPARPTTTRAALFSLPLSLSLSLSVTLSICLFPSRPRCIPSRSRSSYIRFSFFWSLLRAVRHSREGDRPRRVGFSGSYVTARRPAAS